MTNSRSKGKRGELELSKELTRIFGCSARRSQQAEGDAKATDCPVVFHRKNGKPWNVSLRLDDLPGLITIFTEYEKNANAG